MNTNLRRISIFAGLVILLGSFAASRFLSQQKEPPARKVAAAQVRQVDTMQVRNTHIPTTLEIQGSLTAFDKIDLFAEVSGALEESSRPFKVGSYFPKGSVLIRINAEEARLSLLSQKSNLLNAITQLMPDLKIDYPESFRHWQEYLRQFDLEEPIQAFPAPINEQEKYFIASRNLYSQYYSIKSTEERLSKYTLYAPFSGVITQASINAGAVVRTGQKLGELMNTNNYELEATAALRDLKYIQVGSPVELYSEDIPGKWAGRIKRISDQVDAGTQTIKVFVSLSGNDLRENMYMRGAVTASRIENALKIPRNLLVNQKAVFVVQDSFLQLQEVQVVKITEDAAIVRGIEDGTPLLKEMPPGAFDGMKVKVAGKEEEVSAADGEEKVIGSLE
ncbi:MAG: HlyD family efflux transporter periplasmic adaptor subunit [Lewinellaceae bacterium]|nr:HlyD family efflux transporter periplasmic adaptor subunit [Phaeodactylibacter sp.]MCB9348639.1 HlyD family efflux transporter periplasmic adaptor subunit [Lewinellaceae bacterium]